MDGERATLDGGGVSLLRIVIRPALIFNNVLQLQMSRFYMAIPV
eukprot:SAG31_NODE_3053_length_4739_cov_24.623060_4_plen_44_part_00